jgi:hypothetical protein
MISPTPIEVFTHHEVSFSEKSAVSGVVDHLQNKE